MKVLAIQTSELPHTITLEAAVQQSREWTAHLGVVIQDKVERIFRKSGVEQRSTAIALAQIFQPMTLEERNALYRETIVTAAEEALRKALAALSCTPDAIDCLIVTSCTGHMSPSLDAVLINRLKLRPDVQRLPVMEMGCIGGVVGFIYAENYLRAYPGRKVAVIAAELTSVTFQQDDYSWANIVSAAIFGDGVACAILGDSEQVRPCLIASRMHHFANTTDLLGFDLCNTGFRMVLSPELPNVIRAHFHEFLEPLLSSTAGWQLADLRHFLVHPGGKKILHNLELQLRQEGFETDYRLEESRQVLQTMGNMSSATILFILKRLLDKNIPSGEKGILLGFGPGLTAGALLLEWR